MNGKRLHDDIIYYANGKYKRTCFSLVRKPSLVWKIALLVGLCWVAWSIFHVSVHVDTGPLNCVQIIHGDCPREKLTSAEQERRAFIDHAHVLMQHNQRLFNASRTAAQRAFEENRGLSLWRTGSFALHHPNSAYIWDYLPLTHACPTLENLGGIGDSQQWLCGVEAYLQKPTCVIYSVAFHKDILFEEEALRRTRCSLFIFDPTLTQEEAESIKRQLGPRSRIFLLGVSDRDAQETIQVEGREVVARTKLLSNVLTSLEHPWVDVLKLDIDGWEYRGLWPLVASGKLPFTQILMEVHDKMGRMEVPKIYKLMKGLEHNGGYRVFHKAPNMEAPEAVWQFSLIKVDRGGRVVHSPELEEVREVQVEFDDLRHR